MPTSLLGAGILFNDATTMNDAFVIRAIRYAGYATPQTNSAQQADDFLNVAVTMPPTTSATSRYLILAESNTDDTNQVTAGAGVSIWVQVNGGTSYWVSRPGTHSTYSSFSADKYYSLHNVHIDDGANTVAIAAGQTRLYRLYGQNHNGNIIFQAGVANQYANRTKIVVIEFDGAVAT